jgi:hypothetical protein
VPLGEIYSDTVVNTQLLSSPTGEFVYFYYEGSPDNTARVRNLYAFSLDSKGSLTPTPRSPFAMDQSERGQLALSPSGKYLFFPECITGESDCSPTMAVYGIDGDTGELSSAPVSQYASQGINAAYNPDPSGNVILSGSGSASLTSLLFNQSSGVLTQVDGSPFSIKVPFMSGNGSIIARVP